MVLPSGPGQCLPQGYGSQEIVNFQAQQQVTDGVWQRVLARVTDLAQYNGGVPRLRAVPGVEI